MPGKAVGTPGKDLLDKTYLQVLHLDISRGIPPLGPSHINAPHAAACAQAVWKIWPCLFMSKENLGGPVEIQTSLHLPLLRVIAAVKSLQSE